MECKPSFSSIKNRSVQTQEKENSHPYCINSSIDQGHLPSHITENFQYVGLKQRISPLKSFNHYQPEDKVKCMLNIVILWNIF